MNRFGVLLVVIGMALTPWCVGYKIAMVNLTYTTGLYLIAAIITVVFRSQKGLPIVPSQFVREPAVIVAAVYFSIGLCTGIAAADKVLFFKEVVQRTMLIWVPLYCTSLGLRKLEHAEAALLWYVPSGCILAFISAAAGISSKFATPVYVMGLHKNMTAGLCATAVIICIARLLTQRNGYIQVRRFKIASKFVFTAAAFLGLLGIIAAQGRAGLIEVMCATLVMLWICRARPTTMLKAVVISVVGLTIAYKMLPENAIDHIVSTEQHSANAVRILLWSTMWSRFTQNPLMLVGWGNPFVDERGFYFYDVANVFLFDWMQMGIAGALTLLVMMVISVKVGIDNRKLISPQSLGGFVNTAALGIVFGKFVHAFFDAFWIGRGHSLHVWTCIGITLFVKYWFQQLQARQTARGRVMRQPSVSRA